MPRNRASVDRSAKVDAILDVAEAQLTAGGFSALSVAAVGRELGVAGNAIYWYFPTKDELLVGVARRQLEQTLQDPPVGASPVDQAVWMLDRLESAGAVRDAVLVRSAASPVVAAYRSELHSLLHAFVASWLSGVASDDDLELLTEAVLATAEGLLLRRIEREQRNRILRVGLMRLIGPAAIAAKHGRPPGGLARGRRP